MSKKSSNSREEIKKNGFVSKEEFDGAMNLILNRLESLAEKKVEAPGVAVVETKEEKEIKAHGPNRVDTNPEWNATAEEILGDYLDHTEVEHTKTGGIRFTVVIKSEKSNAPKDYLQMYKTDRRTKDVGGSGEEGVIEHCKLVRSNLKRTERN